MVTKPAPKEAYVSVYGDGKSVLQLFPSSCKQAKLNPLIPQCKTGDHCNWVCHNPIRFEGTFLIPSPKMLMSKPSRRDLSLTLFHKVGTPNMSRSVSVQICFLLMNSMSKSNLVMCGVFLCAVNMFHYHWPIKKLI